jgi:hypothetical protein
MKTVPTSSSATPIGEAALGEHLRRENIGRRADQGGGAAQDGAEGQRHEEP